MEQGHLGGAERTLAFFQRHHVWHLVTRNPLSTSCRDAANKRRRLGSEGIPLEDELKSFLGEYTDDNGRQHYVAVHCRGNQMLDFEKVAATLSINAPPERLCDDQTSGEENDLYGLVNPFNLADGFRDEPVRQIFDPSVLDHRGLPNTMMTNAGDRTWAVEFRPAEVIQALGDRAIVASVVVSSQSVVRKPSKIGIITGNAPQSGIILWQHVNRKAMDILGTDFRGDLSYPPVSVRSVPGLGLSMELHLREDQVWEHLEEATLSLIEEGVGILALACHTNHHFTDRIRAIARPHDVDFISVAETVTDWVRSNAVEAITLIGIRYVADLGDWSAYRILSDVCQVRQPSEKVLEQLHALGYGVKQKGATESGHNQLRSILEDHVTTKHVIVALTELSILLSVPRKKNKNGSERVIVDALELYGQEIAEAYLRLAGPRGSILPAA